MDENTNEIGKATLLVQQIVENKQNRLDGIADTLRENDVLPQHLTRFHVEKGTTTAAIESLKHNLAYLEGELEVMKEHNYELYPEKLGVLSNLAKIWLSKSSVELQETLVEEKLKQSALKEDISRQNSCLNENKKILEVLLKEKRSLENKHEELETEKTKVLEEKLAKGRRKYEEMKIHLKETIDTYYPNPQVPGYIGIHALLNDLTKRLQNRDRDTYIKLTNSVWPYYIEVLERSGIIERNPTDKLKIRIVDFSDGRLG